MPAAAAAVVSPPHTYIPPEHVHLRPFLRSRLASLEHDAAASGVWEDSGRAQGLLARLNTLRAEIDEVSINPSCMLEAWLSCGSAPPGARSIDQPGEMPAGWRLSSSA